jgi:hypothetical protein
MSKAVRIREHLYDEIERLAKQERRSLISQLEVLLEQALRIESSASEVAQSRAAGRPVVRATPTSSDSPEPVQARSSEADSHFKPDFK